MSQPMIAKPLLVLLLVSAVLSIVSMLTPQQNDIGSQVADDLVADVSTKKSPVQPTAESMVVVNWQRHLSGFKEAKPAHNAVASVKPVVTQVAPTVPVVEVSSPVAAQPSASTIPFTYLGRLIGADKTTVFLAVNEENVAVTTGDVLERDWKIESISETAVNFRYLPSNSPQQLVISEP